MRSITSFLVLSLIHILLKKIVNYLTIFPFLTFLCLYNACRTIQKHLNQACWCKFLNCSGARFLRNFAKNPCTLKRITFWFFLKSGDNQWILTVKTKVLTHKIEILTRFYIIAFANAIIPVSYTHLDVYKRQFSHRSNWNTHIIYCFPDRPRSGQHYSIFRLFLQYSKREACLLYTSRCV